MTFVRREWIRAALGVFQPADTTRRETPGAADPLQRPQWIGGTRRVVGDFQNHPLVVSVERQLGCTCPCGLDIFTCRTTDFTCTYSPALHDEVVALVSEGKNADEVIAAFVAKYGEEILLAPKATGFGVVGYALPGAAIALMGGVLAWVLVRRSRRINETAPVLASASAPSGPATAEERARVERALEDLEA